MAQIFEDFDKRHLTSFSVKTKTNIFCKQKSFDTHRQNRTQCLLFCFKLFQGNYGIIMLRFRDNWAQTFWRNDIFTTWQLRPTNTITHWHLAFCANQSNCCNFYSSKLICKRFRSRISQKNDDSLGLRYVSWCPITDCQNVLFPVVPGAVFMVVHTLMVMVVTSCYYFGFWWFPTGFRQTETDFDTWQHCTKIHSKINYFCAINHAFSLWRISDCLCDQIGRFLKVLGDKFAYKSSPNINCRGYFFGIFGKIWATF